MKIIVYNILVIIKNDKHKRVLGDFSSKSIKIMRAIIVIKQEYRFCDNISNPLLSIKSTFLV